MVNYKKGKIYKLFNKVNDKYYIGSTCSTLKNRKSGHKCEPKQKPNRLKNKEILKIGWLDSNGKQNWFMKKICDFPCDCKGELLKEEGKHIRRCIEKDGDLVLNTQIEGRTKEERKLIKKKWKEDHKEKVKIESHQYWEDNKENIKKHRNEKIKCECGFIGSRKGMWKHKKSKKHLKWVKEQVEGKPSEEELNKIKEDKIKKSIERLREKIKCGCGSIVQRRLMWKHKKTKKHKKWLSEQD